MDYKDMLLDALERQSEINYNLLKPFWAGFGIRARGKDLLIRKASEKYLHQPCEEWHGGWRAGDLALVGDAIARLDESGQVIEAMDLSTGLPSESLDAHKRPTHKVDVQDGIIVDLKLLNYSDEGLYAITVELEDLQISDDLSLEVCKQIVFRNGPLTWSTVHARGKRVPGLLLTRGSELVRDTSSVQQPLSWNALALRARDAGMVTELHEMDYEELLEFLSVHAFPGEALAEKARYIIHSRSMELSDAILTHIIEAQTGLSAHNIAWELGWPMGSDFQTIHDACEVLVSEGELARRVRQNEDKKMVVYEEIQTDLDAPEPEPKPAKPEPKPEVEIDLSALEDDLFDIAGPETPDPSEPDPEPEPGPEPETELTIEQVIAFLRSLDAPKPDNSEELDCLRTEVSNLEQDLSDALDRMHELEEEIEAMKLPASTQALPDGVEGDIARLGRGVSERLVRGLKLWTLVADARRAADEFIATSGSYSYSDIEAMADARAWICALEKRFP